MKHERDDHVLRWLEMCILLDFVTTLIRFVD